MAKIVAVCSSVEKGTRKKPVAEGILKEHYGLIGDAHAESGIRRQVSLLAIESISKMQESGFNVGPGDFAENITCEGIDLASLPIGTRLTTGKEVVLEVTQIGKECHSGCAIFTKIGQCVMPKEGVFARVVKGGPVKAGDPIVIAEGRVNG